MLRIDRDLLATGERRKVDVLVPAIEAQDDAVVVEAFLHHPLAGTDLVHEIDGALLEHARLDDGLDIVAAVLLQDDRFDALQVQNVRQQQSGRAGADDADLRSDLLHDASSPRVRMLVAASTRSSRPPSLAHSVRSLVSCAITAATNANTAKVTK